ncbi:superoxide dismutase [Natrialba sp. PRR66]|uniref:superoxide dismutase n=1 Tax=Natrialba sp. PRR66 TaxID=3098146 RepID=UPI002B1CE702|nr:superoxide dismutase [Natrialba sp. PRR66]
MSDQLLGSEPQRRSILQTIGGVGGLALFSSAAAGSMADSDDCAPGASGRPDYRLPELPYAYDALEPHIDARIMELHHDKHHQSYVDSANAAVEELEEMRANEDFEGIRSTKRDLSFNLSGHVNHTVFWASMSPDGGGTPDGALATAIENQFGSFEAFQAEFTAAATAVEGAGWAMLFYEPLADALVIGQVEDQNELAHQGATPLLPLDVWEHAYYLQYENDREAYVDAWWNVVDWTAVGQRYEILTELRCGLNQETGDTGNATAGSDTTTDTDTDMDTDTDTTAKDADHSN